MLRKVKFIQYQPFWKRYQVMVEKVFQVLDLGGSGRVAWMVIVFFLRGGRNFNVIQSGGCAQQIASEGFIKNLTVIQSGGSAKGCVSEGFIKSLTVIQSGECGKGKRERRIPLRGRILFNETITLRG
jgi:ribosome-associated protein YbcJ (S4-like RNA binding protein)